MPRSNRHREQSPGRRLAAHVNKIFEGQTTLRLGSVIKSPRAGEIVDAGALTYFRYTEYDIIRTAPTPDINSGASGVYMSTPAHHHDATLAFYSLTDRRVRSASRRDDMWVNLWIPLGLGDTFDEGFKYRRRLNNEEAETAIAHIESSNMVPTEVLSALSVLSAVAQARYETEVALYERVLPQLGHQKSN